MPRDGARGRFLRFVFDNGRRQFAKIVGRLKQADIRLDEIAIEPCQVDGERSARSAEKTLTTKGTKKREKIHRLSISWSAARDRSGVKWSLVKRRQSDP